MEKLTVQMVQMKWDVHTQHVSPTCSDARMENAFHHIGFVILIMIVLMAVMKKDAVSIVDISRFCPWSHSPLRFSKCFLLPPKVPAY
jgi:hypothetical protein